MMITILRSVLFLIVSIAIVAYADDCTTAGCPAYSQCDSGSATCQCIYGNNPDQPPKDPYNPDPSAGGCPHNYDCRTSGCPAPSATSVNSYCYPASNYSVTNYEFYTCYCFYPDGSIGDPVNGACPAYDPCANLQCPKNEYCYRPPIDSDNAVCKCPWGLDAQGACSSPCNAVDGPPPCVNDIYCNITDDHGGYSCPPCPDGTTGDGKTCTDLPTDAPTPAPTPTPTPTSASSSVLVTGGPVDNPLQLTIDYCGVAKYCITTSNLGYSTLRFLTIRIRVPTGKTIVDVAGLGGSTTEADGSVTYNVDLFGGLPRYSSYNKTSSFAVQGGGLATVEFFAYSF